MKKYISSIAIALTLVLTACGFEPLYAANQNEGSVLIGSSFKVDKIDYGRPGQKLQYRLEDLLNHGKNGEKQYRLNVALEKNTDGVGIQKDRYITRYNVRVRAVYEVFDIATSKKILSGTSSMVGGYDAVTSQFGTYSADENTTLSLMDELAKDIVLSISTKLSDAKSVEKLVEEQATKEREPALPSKKQ
jgi:LPS-assembly lipoprotein